MNFGELLIPQVGDGPMDTFRFATVTSTRPVRVRVDGDSSETAAPPVLLAAAGTGDRVLVQFHGRQLFLVGKVGGGPGVTELGSIENLNDLLDTNTYHQAQNAETSMGKNYPIELAGMLEVINATRAAGGGNQYVYQRYSTYNGSEVFQRAKYSTSWSTWSRLIADNPEAWTNASIKSPWSSFGGGYSYPRYYKDYAKRVHLEGMIKGGGSGNTMFTLPTGYRPEYDIIVSAHTSPGGAVCRITILASGDVLPGTGASSSWVSLSGIDFRTA